MSDEPPFRYERSDVPLGMTLAEYRAELERGRIRDRRRAVAIIGGALASFLSLFYVGTKES